MPITRKERGKLIDNHRKYALLAHYSEAEPRRYLQIDGFIDDGLFPDGVIFQHGERLGMTYGESHELWRGPYGLRIHIAPETSAADAIQLLQDAIEVLKNMGEPADILHNLRTGDDPSSKESLPSAPVGKVLQFPERI